MMRRLKQIFCVECAKFSGDGSRIVSASLDSTALVWDTNTGQRLTPPLKHQDRVFYASFSPDGRYVVTASEDNTARVWDSTTGTAISPRLEHSSAVRRAWFSPDHQQLVTATVDGTAKAWDLSTRRLDVDERIATAVMLAGRQIGPEGDLEWIDHNERRAKFEGLRTNYPETYVSAPEHSAIWHRSEALDVIRTRCQKLSEPYFGLRVRKS